MYCPICKKELEDTEVIATNHIVYYCNNCNSQIEMNIRYNVDWDYGYEDDDYDLEYGVD